MPRAYTYFYPGSQPYELLLDPVSGLARFLILELTNFVVKHKRLINITDSDAQ